MLPTPAALDKLESIIKEPLKAPLPVYGFLHAELSVRNSVSTVAYETMVRLDGVAFFIGIMFDFMLSIHY